ncbi:MAG: class I SAM-dependent methyltransferase [Acidimicrobiia bacterium]|nr:class I SAM-dependent methyltransferase [Acidimicrobiia bacterium]
MNILRRAVRPVRGPVRRVVRRYRSGLENLIHAVNHEMVGKFNHMDFRMDQVSGTLVSSHNAISDQLALQGARLMAMEQTVRQVQAEADALAAELSAVRSEIGFARKDIVERIAQVAPSVRLRELTGARLDAIDSGASAFLNYAASHQGPLADAGLWVNTPVTVEWQEGAARLGSVNERILEQPFVFAALGDLAPGTRVLDVGGAESTVALSLASLGYRVTVAEPQGYPFRHPNLTVHQGPVASLVPEAPFDAVVLLSAIEHFGLGHYPGGGDNAAGSDADVAAMRQVARLMASGGRLVLTTPYGPAAVNDVERTYDRDGVMRLLDGWRIHYAAVGRRVDDVTWELEATELIEPPGPSRVVMIVAGRSETTA